MIRAIEIEGELAPNITPDAKTGIGDWSAIDISGFLQTNLLPDGDSAQGLMAEIIDKGYKHLSESDLKAIAVYSRRSRTKSRKNDNRPNAGDIESPVLTMRA